MGYRFVADVKVVRPVEETAPLRSTRHFRVGLLVMAAVLAVAIVGAAGWLGLRRTGANIWNMEGKGLLYTYAGS